MSMKYITFVPFEKCEEHLHYFIKMNIFVPLCGPSNG